MVNPFSRLLDVFRWLTVAEVPAAPPPALSPFQACCAFTLAQEGGFCNVQGDPGGATNHGVTMAELSAVLGRQATLQDVQGLSVADAEAIYKARYWDAVYGDELAPGVNLVVFDFGVNAGPGTSVRRLQALLGVAEDGVIGPLTMTVLKAMDAQYAVSMLTYSHQVYYQGLPGYAEFGAGWIARTKRCQAAAMGMIP